MASLLALNVAAAAAPNRSPVARRSKTFKAHCRGTQATFWGSRSRRTGASPRADLALTSECPRTPREICRWQCGRRTTSRYKARCSSVNTAIAGPISYDLFLPPPARPILGRGDTAYINSHSLSIYNQFLQSDGAHRDTRARQIHDDELRPAVRDEGGVEPRGPGPQAARSSSTCRVTPRTYLLDNLRLDGPPVLTACTTTPNKSAATAAEPRRSR